MMKREKRCPKCGGLMVEKCDGRSFLVFGHGAVWEECERCGYIESNGKMEEVRT